MDLKLNERILIFDGAMGTEVSKKIKKEDNLPNDFLNLTAPEIIEDIHLSYINAGADVIETNTFNSNLITLGEFNKTKYFKELNEKAVSVAKNASKKSDKKIYICASIGPLTVSLSLGSKYDFDEIKTAYIKQLEILFNSGVDLAIFETAHDMINLKAGLCAAYEIFGYKKLPIIASVTLNSNGFMLSGHDIKSVYSNLSDFDLLALGINCSVGPKDMEIFIKTLSDISHFPTLIMPNAGFPDEKGGYDLSPESFSQTLTDYAKKGFINIAGGCCGTGPSHIKSISESLKNIKPRDIKKEKKFSISHKIAIFEDDIEKPFLAAERLNALGSKKFRDMVSNSDVDGIISLAKEQVKKGAHLLDISFINPERDEKKDILKFLPLVASNVRIPIMIDSTNIDSFETALKIVGSKLVLNSINFENGEEKPLKAVYLQKKYGCVLVLGLIDEDKKMPFEFEKKMKIFERAVKFFKDKDADLNNIIFDPLVFPIATADYKKSAYDTLLAVEEINKKGFKTILGLSNVSFGLPQITRKYLNSVFLYMSIKKGLDFAILNVMEKIPYALIDKEIRDISEKILNGEVDLIKELVEKTSGKKAQNNIQEKKLSEEESLRKIIVEGAGEIEGVIDSLLLKYPADFIINNFIIPAMNEVGEKFSKGEYIVTEVLSCASLSQRAIDLLKPYIKKDNFKRGKLLLATVKGDVHDIGKNLVSIIFESNGFEVVDLGTKVEPEIIVEMVLKENPDFIGLSGLLARSCEYMVETALKLKENNITVPLLLGGAALSERFVLTKIKPIYENSFYSKDAIDGVKVACEWKKI